MLALNLAVSAVVIRAEALVAGRNLPERLTDRLVEVFNAAVAHEWKRVQARIASERRRHPEARPAEIAERIVRDFRRDVTAIGVAAGGTAAIPGPGTAVRVAGLGAEGLALLERSIFMTLAVAHAYGHDLSDVEIRKYAIFRVLGLWAGAAEGMMSFSSLLAMGLGKKATKAVPMGAVHAINKAVGKRVLVKWATTGGAIRLGSALPFGIGAAFGGGGNYAMARGLGRVAIEEFR
jgi:hypothetical protein